MKKNDINVTFGFITLLLFVIIFVRSIFSDGMFFDGILYASVSNNLAHNIGSFWELQYTSTLHASFHEQPPLSFFIQAQFFKLFGDSIYVERFYCFLFALVSIYLIIRIWKEATDKENRQYWVPVLFWISIPLTSWTYQNNLLEVPMGTFDLCAIYFILKGCKKDSLIFLGLGGLFTFLAFFCKGLQGLFPLAAPALYWIIFRSENIKRVFLQLFVVSAIPLVMVIFFYFYPASHNSFEMYLERRLVGSFNHLQDTTKTHFYLLYKLGMELLIPILITLLVWWVERKRVADKVFDRRAVILLTSIGLTASLPLMVTLEQRPFYLATSFPYFALALGLLALPFINSILEKIKSNNLKLLNLVLLGCIVIALLWIAGNAKNPKREHELIKDLAIICEQIPQMSTISVSPEITTNWAYNAYFMRYCKISLDGQKKHPYFLSSQEGSVAIDSCYQKINIPLKKFILYSCE